MNLLCVTFALMVVTSQVLHCHGNSCWAPPFVCGPVCKANKATWGSPGFKWLYEVTVTGKSGTLVCCEGYSHVDRSFHTIGCGSDSFELKLDWGNTVAYPRIKCRGYPFGAFVSWD